ncbi:hypothetical protein [Clostridium sp.]|uniref:hypothetical protein n=1 Tax=Clostridium sp. TaxID=1506 RepID=UPI002841E7B2|nr:hypothetical protein [Clostridium sp.]MDR3598064.1 hypothetical protein [Clostridium sp.]
MKIGGKLKYYIEKVFKESNENGYNIKLNEDSSNVGIKGCTTYIEGEEEEKLYLIFDCGQTFIKRSLVKMQVKEVKDIIKLDKVLFKHVAWNFENCKKEENEAMKLHKFLLNLIIDTIEAVTVESEVLGII